MAVTSVEKARSRSGGQSKSGRKTIRTYEDEYVVISDDNQDTAYLILANVLLPSIGAGYTNDAGAVCKSRNAVRDGTSLVWKVTVGYSSETDTCETHDPDDPLDDPLQISGSFSVFQKPIEKDFEGEPIHNTAGQPFDPPIEIDDARFNFVVTKNISENAFSLGFYADFMNTVNSDTWNGFQPRTVKLQGMSFIKATLNCINYYATSFEFSVKPDTWDLEVLNQGMMARTGAGNPPRVVVRNGLQITEPIPLAESGVALPEGDDPHYITFKVYKERPFAPLNITI